MILAVLALSVITSPADAARAGLSPVTRVVELMKGLSKKIEAEGKTEEDLYETYVCWAKTVIDTKTKSNEAADSRMSELKAYIADIDAGRIEFTDERGTLTKELADLNAEIEAAKDLRDKQNSDFLEAEDEMKKAIVALEKAIETMKEATKGHEEGTFVQLDQSEGFHARQERAKLLTHAVELGEKFLTKFDALFLRRVLTGDVPDVDWKKLNRKATFKMKYKMRSGKIQDLLAKLLSTFKTNLKDAQDKEAKTQTEYDELMKAKNAQKSKTEDALSGMEAETGARGMALEDSNSEKDALTKQVENDKKFIENTIKDLADKKAEWKDRSELRAGELAAVTKAIGILHSDDARDLFKKSFSSQELLLLQVEDTAARGIRAAGVIRRIASKDRRLSMLALKVQQRAGGHFDAVISDIDKMIVTLKKEEESDKEIKEDCEADRMEDARKSVKTSRTIDEHSEKIMKLEAEIAQIKVEIKDKEDKIASIKKELAEAKKNREDENAEFKQTQADDEAAAKLVKMAQGVLEDFYKENGLSLVQRKKMEPVVAGEAPPPPPPTWEAPYGGATGESQGIVAILGMIHEDIKKDAAKAKAEEEEAQSDYDEFKEESESEIKDMNEEIDSLEGVQGDKEEAVKDNKGERKTLKGELDAVTEKMKDALPLCDFMTINYEMRIENRQIEIDGLDQAKGILSG